MMMEATALLDGNADPSDDEVSEALGDNLCRCGTHEQIRAAVSRAAEETEGSQ
jgi:isoquinoline 1-oxidoreductase alpha subunit